MTEEQWLSPQVRAQILKRRTRLHPLEDFKVRTAALVIVDMQTGFIDTSKYGAIALPSARNIVPAVNRLAAAIRSAGGLVVWVISTYGDGKGGEITLSSSRAVSPEVGDIFRNLFTEGHEAHSLWMELEREPDDVMVNKNCFAAFYGSGERLTSILRDKGIDTVIVAGLQTSICCETTAREANVRGFKVIMVEDGNAGRIPTEDAATFSIILRAFGDVLNTDRLIARISGAHPGEPSTY